MRGFDTLRLRTVLLPSARALLACSLILIGCGPAAQSSDEPPRRIADKKELDGIEAASHSAEAPQPAWKRSRSPMPETFVAFALPELGALDGAWLVESEVPGRRALWLIEEAGAKLTEIDHRGQERVYGLALASPCALRMTDEQGQGRTRAIAMAGDELVITRQGATAVVGNDGSMLACAGHRTYQIAADGRCRFTSEMLGAWTDPATPAERCALGHDDQGRTLTIGDQVLHDVEGLWLDARATNARATKVADREAGMTALIDAGTEAGAEAEAEVAAEVAPEDDASAPK